MQETVHFRCLSVFKLEIARVQTIRMNARQRLTIILVAGVLILHVGERRATASSLRTIAIQQLIVFEAQLDVVGGSEVATSSIVLHVDVVD